MRFKRPAAVVFLFLLGACSPTTMVVSPVCNMGAVDDQRQLQEVPSLESPMNSVNITDKSIINKMFANNVTARRTATGTVEVIAQIINCTDYPLVAEARTQFYDTGKVPSEPVSAWKRFHLPAKTSNAYRESSIGTRSVEYYTVEMRETR